MSLKNYSFLSSHIKSFKTSENFFIFHYLKPNQIYYYQLYLLNSTGKRVAASSRLRFETLATLIDGFKSVKTTSDAIVSLSFVDSALYPLMSCSSSWETT